MRDQSTPSMTCAGGMRREPTARRPSIHRWYGLPRRNSYAMRTCTRTAHHSILLGRRCRSSGSRRFRSIDRITIRRRRASSRRVPSRRAAASMRTDVLSCERCGRKISICATRRHFVRCPRISRRGSRCGNSCEKSPTAAQEAPSRRSRCGNELQPRRTGVAARYWPSLSTGRKATTTRRMPAISRS